MHSHNECYTSYVFQFLLNEKKKLWMRLSNDSFLRKESQNPYYYRLSKRNGCEQSKAGRQALLECGPA